MLEMLVEMLYNILCYIIGENFVYNSFNSLKAYIFTDFIYYGTMFQSPVINSNNKQNLLKLVKIAEVFTEI